MNSILRILFCLFVTSLCSWSQDVSRPSEVLKGISDDVLKELRQHRPGEPAPQAAIDKANQQMETYCRGKSGSFALVIDEVDEKTDAEKIHLVAKKSSERLLGKTVILAQGVILEPSQKQQALKLKKGNRIIAMGEPWGMFSVTRSGLELSFWLSKATLK